jgi:glycosyltransferase involved in cell wall biosynthesis
MTSERTPRVSIGMPVYNGEDYLAAAIDSILSQTWSDFELVVSDNASTDGTGDICRVYAEKDGRVRVHRNERNLGAAPNYNRTFALSRGTYFKWAAHDDLIEPTYLERCVAALDAEPDAVLCQTLVRYVDDGGGSLGIYDSGLRGAASPRASERFATLVLSSHACTDFFGLIRRSALEGSLLHGSYNGHDRAFLAEMALRGRLIQVREPLQLVREHPSRYTQSAHRPAERLAWHDASLAGRRSFPAWRLYTEYARMVGREVRDPRERLRCYGHLVRWLPRHWNWARLVVDLIAAFAPGFLWRAERFKQRVFAPAPRHRLDGGDGAVDG